MEKFIKRDVHRTFPEVELFSAADGLGQHMLYNVLRAYASYDTEVGYCQGTAFIVGSLLMHMPEEESFRVLVHLMEDYRLRGLYRPSMADLLLYMYQFDCLVQSHFPALWDHFASIGILSNMYVCLCVRHVCWRGHV